MKNDPVVAIAGVTGAVGAEFIATMDRRGFPRRQAEGAGERALGRQDHRFPRRADRDRGARPNTPSTASTSRCSPPAAAFRRSSAPIAVKAGAVVIDNSSAFRMDPNVPLVIPEINANRIREHKGIIAVPNCSAITALMPLWPIHRQQPHQARDHLDLSGRERRAAPRRWRSWWNRPAPASTGRLSRRR